MLDEIHVLAISKTGERGFPHDHVVEVAVFKVDLSQNMMESVYESVVHQETAAWPDEVRAHVQDAYGITPAQVEMGRDEDEVASELRDVLQDKVVTSFDVKTDFMGYLMNEPWDLAKETEVSTAISARSSFVYRFPPSRVGDPELLRETYRNVLPDDPVGAGGSKGAYGDAAMASALLLELHDRGLY